MFETEQVIGGGFQFHLQGLAGNHQIQLRMSMHMRIMLPMLVLRNYRLYH